MKILTVLPYVPSLIRVRPYNLLRELTKRHDVSLLVVGPRPGDHEIAEVSAHVSSIHVASHGKVAALASCAGAVWRREPLQSAIGAARAAGEALHSILAAERFDVVHVEHLRAAFLEAALPPDMPRVFDSVDAISLLWERTKDGSHSLFRRTVAAMELGPTRRYEARLMSRFDRVAVTSPEDAATLRDLNADAPVTVIPNGVDLDYFRVSDRQVQPDTLVFSGKMSYHANETAALYLVRNVLPLVQARVPAVRLRIVGSEPTPLVRSLAREPHIEVTGHLPDLRQAIASATVSVCPVTVKVGIQNKILEAMALQVPVVSTTQGALGLQAQNGQDLLIGRDAVELAQHIVTLLTDEQQRGRFGLAGRRYVERHHQWSSAAQAFENLYSEAATARQRTTVAGNPPSVAFRN